MKPEQSMATILNKLGAKIISVEEKFGTPTDEAEIFVSDFIDLVEAGVCILGSPLLTNIAHDRKTLGSCTAVPCRFDTGAQEFLSLAEKYYELNMGSGFNLTSSPNPVEILLRLNEHAKRRTEIDSYERYIGNIAHIDVGHPSIIEFINAKIDNIGIKHFNTSINIDAEFMKALSLRDEFRLLNGQTIAALEIWEAICMASWRCGDPGIICLERFNKSNSVAEVSPYITTAPCAEAGLAEGESCVFGYINLAACIDQTKNLVNLRLVGQIAMQLTRVLDDALEISLDNFPTDMSNEVMRSNRKIGIGLCGYSDALLWLGVEYGSDRARAILNEVLSAINYSSKIASYRLAQVRGAFPNFRKSKYYSSPEFLGRFSEFSSVVPGYKWHKLAMNVQKNGIRNAMTVTLPPSGRSSIILGVNSSIEPFFDRNIKGNRALPFNANNSRKGMYSERENLLKTAWEITPIEHLNVVSEANNLLDDGASKTVNLPSDSTSEDVSKIFQNAWDLGLKAMSVYRNQGAQN